LIVPEVNTHPLMESDFWFDVILSRWRPRRHFMPKSAATRWVQMQQRPPVRDPWYIRL